jgi:hypothetical protein
LLLPGWFWLLLFIFVVPEAGGFVAFELPVEESLAPRSSSAPTIASIQLSKSFSDGTRLNS